MAIDIGKKLTNQENDYKIAKLIECLEQGGERLKDEAIGLKKLSSQPLWKILRFLFTPKGLSPPNSSFITFLTK